MNFRSFFKPISIALLMMGMSQSILAMENPANKDLLKTVKVALNENLLEAVNNGDLTKVQEFLNLKADVNYTNKFGHTVLYLASSHGYKDIVKLLLDGGADINRAENNFGRFTPLHAASKDNLEIAKLLLDRGADISCRDHYGDTALDVAGLYKSDKIIELIIEEAKRQEFNKWQASCNRRLLETWNGNHDQNNLEALMEFVGNRDKQQKIVKLENRDPVPVAQVKENKSYLNLILSLLSDFSA